jgi:acetylornithine deacetylase
MKKTNRIKTRRLKTLLHELIDIYSPSGKEKEILDYLKVYLKQYDLPVVSQKVDDERYNILIIPPGKSPQVVFVGHVDTVAAFDLDKYKFRQSKDVIYGLGAADMKAGCAAMIEAFVSFYHTYGQTLPAAMALVVGEEETADGIETMLKEHHFTWAVVGEPTNLKPCLEHYGYLELEFSTQGQRRHASLAKPHHNAIIAMLKILLNLSNYLDSQRSDFIYNIRDMHSADAGFTVPDRCLSSLDIHIPPHISMDQVVSELEGVIHSALAGKKKGKESICFATVNSGYKLPKEGILPKALKEVYRKLRLAFKPTAFPSHSDANLLWEAGIKPVLLGPGQLAKAHIENESILFTQVVEAGKIYFELLKALAQR